jgi:hypothetical protein
MKYEPTKKLQIFGGKPFYKTKRFWGAAVIGAMMILRAAGVPVPDAIVGAVQAVISILPADDNQQWVEMPAGDMQGLDATPTPPSPPAAFPGDGESNEVEGKP